MSKRKIDSVDDTTNPAAMTAMTAYHGSILHFTKPVTTITEEPGYEFYEDGYLIVEDGKVGYCR